MNLRAELPRGLLLGVVALLAAAAFGVAGRGQVTLTLDPIRPDTAAEVLAVMLADAAWLLAATVVLVRASPNGAVWPAFRRAAIVNAVLLAVGVLLVTGGGGSAYRPEPSPLIPFATDLDPWTTQFDIPGLRYLLLAAVILVGVTMLVGVVLVGWMLVVTRGRYFRRRAGEVRERMLGRGARRAADPEAVLDAIVRARRALHSDDDARRAVISAYAAMEHAIEARGAERRAAQTPAEFLRAALDDALLRDEEAAARLLRLFELARFSHEELPADAAETTDHDLGLLQADLEQLEVV